MSKGLFIVLEGIDGSGTTTQCKILTDKITRLGHPVVQTREPGGTPLAEQIRALVLDPKSQGIFDLTELLLYAASRAQHVNELLKPSISKGYHVVCDRYTGSTWAYQGYGRRIDLGLVAKVTQIAADGCEPDLTIYLDLPVGVASERRSKRGSKPDRLELAGEAFQERVASGYRELAGRDQAKALVVNGEKSTEAVENEIWVELTKRWPDFPNA